MTLITKNKLQFTRNVDGLGVIANDVDLNGTSKIRLKIEGANGNEIEIKVKLKGQQNYELLETLDTSAELVINVETYDLIQFDCTAFVSTFKFLASGNITYGG